MKKQIIAILAISAAACLMTACKPGIYEEVMRNHDYEVDRSISLPAASKEEEGTEDTGTNGTSSIEISERSRYYDFTVEGKEKVFFSYSSNASARFKKQIIIRGEKTDPTKYRKKYKDEYGEDKINTLYVAEVTIKKIYKEKINDKSEKLKVGDKIMLCETKYKETILGDILVGDYLYSNLDAGEYVFYLNLIADPKDSTLDGIPNLWIIRDSFSTTQPEEFELREELRQEVLKTYN